VRVLNVLLAIAYVVLGLWIGFWLSVASGLAETEQDWQASVLSYLGLVSLPLVVLAVVFTYRRWRLGVALVCLHLALLAVAVPFAASISNWSYVFRLTWFVLIAIAAVGFLLTRRIVNARSSGELGTPAGRFA
jgi:hypothetical protein